MMTTVPVVESVGLTIGVSVALELLSSSGHLERLDHGPAISSCILNMCRVFGHSF